MLNPQGGRCRPPPISEHCALSDSYRETDSHPELWSFGPLCRNLFEDRLTNRGKTGIQQQAKERLLDTVVVKSGKTVQTLLDDLNIILPEAKYAYGYTAQQNFNNDQFLKMLAEDGCLFLLLVYDILGADLDFPDQHPIFGTGCVRKDMKKWLTSIFFVGNQLPYVVVEKLHSMTYFADRRREIEMYEPHSEVLKRALFELVVTNFPAGSKPVDVMGCLRSLLLGPKSGLKANVWMYSADLRNGHKNRPSAMALSERGYDFQPLAIESGIRGIQVCERWLRNNIIYLPVLEVVDYENTSLMFKCLAEYEDVHWDMDPEWTYYSHLLSNFIQGKKDADFLNLKGIIQGRNFDRLPSILESYYDIRLSNPSGCDRRRIKVMGKGRFWKYVKWVTRAAMVFSVAAITYFSGILQSFYTAYGYYKPRHR